MSVDCIGMAVMMMLLMTMTSGHIFTPNIFTDLSRVILDDVLAAS